MHRCHPAIGHVGLHFFHFIRDDDDDDDDVFIGKLCRESDVPAALWWGYTLDPLQTPVPLQSPLQKCYNVWCWWRLDWLLALFLRLFHFQFFTSRTHDNPHVQMLQWGLSVEPSQEHKSSFIAFYRLLPHRKCRVECTEVVTVSSLFPYWLLANNNPAQYHHQLAGGCNGRISYFGQFNFQAK